MGTNNLKVGDCDKAVRDNDLGKKFDGHGLYLHIRNGAAATWRMSYRVTVDGKSKPRTYTVGPYATTSLDEARKERDKVRRIIAEGKDPVAARRIERAKAAVSTETTFKAVAALWLKEMDGHWSDVHHKKSKRAIERDIYPALSNLPLSEITTAMVANAVDRIAKRAPETASRIEQHVKSIFDYAMRKGLAQGNPVIVGKRQKVKANKQPAYTDFNDLGQVMRGIQTVGISPVVRLASDLLAHSAVRLGELVPAQWSEFHLNARQPFWVIPRSRMKVKSRDNDHKVFLAPGIVRELKNWQQLTGGTGFVFASERSKTGHMTVEALEKCYRVTLGLKGKHVPHGWRAAFSSLANDELDTKGKRVFDSDVIESCLDHVNTNKVKASYDRGERWDARITLMKWWASELATATASGDVVQFRARA